MIALWLLAAALPGIVSSDPEIAQKLGWKRVYAPAAAAEAFRKHGIAISPEADLNGYTKVPPPQTKMRMDVAAATSIPWIDANGWRFVRGLNRAYYADLPPGSALIAAAEAHAYGVDAVLAPHPTDLGALAPMMKFLESAPSDRLPPMANIGVVDDGTPLLGEVLNLLGRRNLLYRAVKDPDPALDLTVKVGTEAFPKAAAVNPNDFAARVREKLSDDKRLLRIYGTYTVIGYLTGNQKRARLYLINYAKRPVPDVHVRVLGAYRRVRALDATDPKLQATDFSLHQGGAEFTIPSLQTYTIVDLEK